MTSGRSTVTAFLAAITGLLLVVVGLCDHWPRWAWLVLAAAVAAGALLAGGLATYRRRLPADGPALGDLTQHQRAAPVERTDVRVSQVALPSEWPDYDFRFSATVRWWPVVGTGGRSLVNPAGLARDAVLARARAVTETREPHRPSLVQHELDGALGLLEPDASGLLYVMAENVTLTLSEPDRERLDKLAAVRKDEAVWEHERKYEVNRRDYLGNDVLKDTGSAVVWWLAKNDDAVERTVEDLGLLAQLSSAAQNEEVPERYRHLVPQPPAAAPQWPDGLPWPGGPVTVAGRAAPVADRFEAFLAAVGLGPDDAAGPLFADRVAEALDAHGLPKAAEEVRRRFDAPAAFGDPGGAGGAGGTSGGDGAAKDDGGLRWAYEEGDGTGTGEADGEEGRHAR